ncbi:GerMN domain-containing protein [Gorillibacterium timonense]|uniref:GerMN domain-containing protein n=1 Tax=Gorillibacterium timonense TaxID=1689269 RepID=UPI00071E4587|nr:GerMN domain-containing protein [Gorillibacterium timonense]
MRIRTILTVILLGSMLAAAGCSAKNTPSSADPKPTEAASPAATSTISEAPTATPEQKTETIKAYYANADGTELVEKTVTIQADKADDKYLNTLKVLTSTDDSNLFPLAKGLQFKSAELEDGTLTVDLSILDEGRLGSGGEVLLMDALQKTVFQFAEINALEILVDGKQIESLMGHVELEHPIKRQ